jgi:hypothetical protein
MRPSSQSDEEIAQLLQDARIKPEAASAQEAAFFAKHGCDLIRALSNRLFNHW